MRGVLLACLAGATAFAAYRLLKAIDDAAGEIADWSDPVFPVPGFSLSRALEDSAAVDVALWLASDSGGFSCICEPTGECEHVWQVVHPIINERN